MGESQSFGEWLRHRRRELDLTQEELARQTGCARITIRKIEADQMHPSKQLAELLIQQLGVAADERESFMHFARGGEPVKSITTTAPRDNLPHPISSFIGREREIEEINRLIHRSRLVTLTGAGGCGKSRLAIEAARQMLDYFPDGVWFMAFAPLFDPVLVQRTIATVMDVHEDPSHPLIETLGARLYSKHLLLVFDNCEHLIAECAQVADQLLRACPRLSVLATSREPLGMEGEEQYYVPCLSLPEVSAETSLERFNQSEAVRLFLNRAALVQSTFALTVANSDAIVQICRDLDGMPLAIELAAARVKMMTVEHIAEALDDRFSLLTSGNRTALPRHQTLQAAIEWSYELLPERTRVLFRRLSVFAGGFTKGAAQAVCSEGGLIAGDVLVELYRLVDRSLVEVIQGSSSERYRMLETIRQYARERLKESGEESQVRDRHLGFFMDWMEKAEPKLRAPEQIVWSDRIETDHDNIRTALEWSLSGGDAQSGLRLAVAALWFWRLRSYWMEGLRWLKAILARVPTGQRTAPRAKALVFTGSFGMQLYLTDPVDEWFEETLGIWRDLGDKWWASLTLLNMGWRRIMVNEAASSIALFEESVACARRTNDAWLLGYALRGLGAATERFDYAAARPILEESLRYLQAVGERQVLAEVLKSLATLAWAQGNYVKLASLSQESFELFQELGDRVDQVEDLTSLARAMLGQEELKQAAGFCRKCMLLAKETGYHAPIGTALMLLACIADLEGQPRRSAALLAAGESLLNSLGTTLKMWPWCYADYERCMASVRTQLGENEFSKATAEGQAMTMDQAINYALENAKED